MSTIHAPPRRPDTEQTQPDEHRYTDRSLTGLVIELRDEATDLIKNEIRLARAELTEKANDVKQGVISGMTGGAVVYAGLLMLLVAAAAGLYVIMREADVSAFVAGWVSPLIVGGLTLIIGLIMLAVARNKMSADHLKPNRTRRSLNETKEWAERKVT